VDLLALVLGAAGDVQLHAVLGRRVCRQDLQLGVLQLRHQVLLLAPQVPVHVLHLWGKYNNIEQRLDHGFVSKVQVQNNINTKFLAYYLLVFYLLYKIFSLLSSCLLFTNTSGHRTACVAGQECLSRILIFPSRIRIRTKEFNAFLTQIIVTKHREI
jgi:hypothetical protein